MEALNNLAERVDRLTAMVETAVLNHASEAAEAVARGVQTHAIIAAIAAGIALVIFWFFFVVGVRMVTAEEKPGRSASSEEAQAFAGVIICIVAGIGLLVALILSVVGAPDTILRATDPIAAIARDVALGGR